MAGVVVERVSGVRMYLGQVVSHCQAHDGVSGGHEDKNSIPEVEEGGQGAEGLGAMQSYGHAEDIRRT